MPVTQARHTNLAIIALILGGVGIGTTEFIAMGLLPETAGDLGVSIPAGGASIAAYAVGVVVGAPILAVAGASWPRRTMLAGLLATLAIGNALVALAPNFGLLVVPASWRAAAWCLLRSRIARCCRPDAAADGRTRGLTGDARHTFRQPARGPGGHLAGATVRVADGIWRDRGTGPYLRSARASRCAAVLSSIHR